MKGIVFTEFIDMVEKQFGLEIADHIIESSDLASSGIYTRVGTYSHFEMVTLVTALSNKTGISISELLNAYAQHFFQVLLLSYPDFFKNQHSCFTFLESVEQYIHPEVLKLYPDAELPRFETEMKDDNTLIMTYYSERKMADFAQGLIEATIDHFKEEITLDITPINPDNSKVTFTLIKTE